MKKNGVQKKRKILWIVIPAAILVLLLSGMLIYLETYYHADEDAIAAFSADRTVLERTLESSETVFDPGNATVGLIFYPGGKVEQEAYAPLMREISAGGVLCVLCKMPFRLAVLDMHRADGVREAFPQIEQWYIGGHSLGGAVASIEVKAHPGVYTGMILLASFSDKDLTEESLRVLSIYGSEDRVLDREQYERAKSLLPGDVTETVIEGGCHSYFGMYGEQNGDGTPSITNEEQIRITTGTVLDWLKDASRKNGNNSKSE